MNDKAVKPDYVGKKTMKTVDSIRETQFIRNEKTAIGSHGLIKKIIIYQDGDIDKEHIEILKFLGNRIREINVEFKRINENERFRRSIDRLYIFIFKSVSSISEKKLSLDINKNGKRRRIKDKVFLPIKDSLLFHCDFSTKEFDVNGVLVIIFPLDRLLDILNACLTVYVEKYLSKKTFIERGDLSGCFDGCFNCKSFLGFPCVPVPKTCIYKESNRPTSPFLPNPECKLFIKGFKIAESGLFIDIDQCNLKIYDSIKNLFFEQFKFIPSKSESYKNCSNENYDAYVNILKEKIKLFESGSNLSLVTTDMSFLKTEGNPWFIADPLIEILSDTKKILTPKEENEKEENEKEDSIAIKNESENNIISRVLIIDFNNINFGREKDERINYIVRRLIPFYLLNRAIGINVYLTSLDRIHEQIQINDINFYFLSNYRINEGLNNKLKLIHLENSKSLGIIDTKFPFIRVFERNEKKPIHNGYITYIEESLNQIFEKSPINNLDDFKKLEDSEDYGNIKIEINSVLVKPDKIKHFHSDLEQRLLKICDIDTFSNISKLIKKEYDHK